ncbi:hypothetical protein [Segetibacter aerophilus]|uniref:DUF481 domain-containing protein n=1 Tax=Segetibacter aerophilus TaxID=670293 RepID=A0A512BGV8_9BACT|nr:hypothetical protein [Segetibacter aerophilus]GEO11202.1 hypothetical protein SAE01_36980 [Segetibacter aerophilus]
MRILLIITTLLIAYGVAAQELFVFAESASSRSAKSVALNVTAKLPDNKDNTYYSNRYVPKVIVGVDKKLMIDASASFSNYYRLDRLQFDGAKIYGKYRFLSVDDVHKHFRMAAFAEGGFSNHSYLYEEMTLEGDNDGIKAGLIATQLFNKFALSATTSYTKIFVEDAATHHDVLNHSTQMVSYSLSAGYLLLPKEYTNYKQINLNLYLELLGDKCLDNDRYLIDLAPALQLIFNSKTKLNIGARFQLESNMLRVGQRTIQVGLERTILNVWK